MDRHYDVVNNRTGVVVDVFDSLKDAELWIAEQLHPNNYEVVPVEIQECSTPLNLFLDSSNLTRNKK